jgi:RNA polymerase sigma-70 factor, ECF subfamily
MELADRALVEKARRKDAEAFAALIRAFERVALSVAYGVLNDSSAAGDVTQDAFIRAWERLAELREPERFGPWLCGIVRNLAIDALRRKRVTQPLAAGQRVVHPERWTSDPLEQVDRRETESRLAAAITSLDEQSRMVVVMRYYEDLSSKEIGKLLEMSPAAVDMRLSRARKQLRMVLEDQPAEEAAEPTA